MKAVESNTAKGFLFDVFPTSISPQPLEQRQSKRHELSTRASTVSYSVDGCLSFTARVQSAEPAGMAAPSPKAFSSPSPGAAAHPRTPNNVVESLKLVQVFDYLGVMGDLEFAKMLVDCQKKDAGECSQRECRKPLCSIFLHSLAYLTLICAIALFCFLAAAGAPDCNVTEELKFSDMVVKINKNDRLQKRALVITNKAIYNFTPKNYRKFQRRILLSDLRSVILSRSSDEVVFQVYNYYDYR